MRVSSMFDLSTSHLPKDEMDVLSASAHDPGGDALPRWIPHTYGAVVFVPSEDGIEEAEGWAMPTLAAILRVAREFNCVLVNFDADAEVHPNLPTHEW